MPIVPKPDDKQFELVPQGNHVAVCYSVIDLGTQKQTYQGKEKLRHVVLIGWEIPDEKMSDGKPFTIRQRFTWSMSEKATLRQMLESWRGKAFVEADFEPPHGFDIKTILGVGCMLNVIHETKDGKVYDNIATVAKLPKGMPAPSLTNIGVYLWLSREEFVAPVFDLLSDKLKEMIRMTPEYAVAIGKTAPAAIVAPAHDDDMDDPIPF